MKKKKKNPHNIIAQGQGSVCLPKADKVINIVITTA